MDNSRRKFLKIAGLSAIAGLAAPTAFNGLLKGEALANESVGAGHGGEMAPTGKRYGFVIDAQQFAQDRDLARRCVNACHSIHNVPDYGNKKDEIKWIWPENYEHAFPEHSQYKKSEALENLPIMTLCNHCDNPPCVRACPTQATFKNPDGIVMMDFHRCIGCRFCMAACPYGARSFNWRNPREVDANGNYKFIKNLNPEFPTRMRGVVEKCNMCSERLDVGKIPACVEAAQASNGIIFGDLNDPDSQVSMVLKEKFTIQRKPALGTHPSIFYII
jgi:molybdopterin-containing oxidoreductase family iron-sulfur binding subunit